MSIHCHDWVQVECLWLMSTRISVEYTSFSWVRFQNFALALNHNFQNMCVQVRVQDQSVSISTSTKPISRVQALIQNGDYDEYVLTKRLLRSIHSSNGRLWYIICNDISLPLPGGTYSLPLPTYPNYDPKNNYAADMLFPASHKSFFSGLFLSLSKPR